jgi:hypothetical protein
MTRRNKDLYGLLPPADHVCGTPDAMCDTDCVGRAYAPLNLHMVVQLRFDREAFTELKELLRAHSQASRTVELSPQERRSRDALKRVFDQIRDVEYSGV